MKNLILTVLTILILTSTAFAQENLNISGIMQDAKMVAIINNEVVVEGTFIEGYEVIKINSNSVEFKKAGIVFTKILQNNQRLVETKTFTQKQEINETIVIESRISKDIDQKIVERVEREANRNKEIEDRQEDKRRFEKELAHQKEMEILKSEEQRKLLNESKGIGIDAHVIIFDNK